MDPSLNPMQQNQSNKNALIGALYKELIKEIGIPLETVSVSDGIDMLQKCMDAVGVGIHSVAPSQSPDDVTISYLFSMPTRIPM